MNQEIKIPQMGESVTEATIGNLIKPSNSYVSEGEEIIELETEKVNQVLYAPCSGVVVWRVEVGQSVKIGDVVGTVDPAQKPSVEPVSEPKNRNEKEEKPEQKVVSPSPKEGKGERIMASQFIQELKEQPASTQQIVEKQVPSNQPQKESSTKRANGRESRQPMSKIRQTIAGRLVDALHNAAMLTTFNEVDMSEVMHLRSKHKESFAQQYGVKLGLMSFFVKAVVEALKEYPGLNSYIDQEEIVTRHYYNIGIAVGTDRGLFVPVLKDCQDLGFPEIEKQIQLYADKARQGKITIPDLEGGGFTITNGGVYGSLLSTPILNPPQSGILGMHKIMKRAVVEEDQIVIRPMMYLALSYDHRIVDGKEAIGFLVKVKEVLEDPSRLLFKAS